MILFFYSCISCIIFYSLFVLFKYLKFFKIISKKFDDKLDDDKGLFISIPCLREQNVIEETVKYFRKICDLPIVIVTTQKEEYEYKYNKLKLTTKTFVENNILNKYDNIFLIDCPSINGYMADNLNYMLEQLKKLPFYDNSKEWYMSLYNADSKPSKNSFNAIFYEINRDKKVMQQYSYCFNNFKRLSLIMKGFAIYQSNFEIKVGLFNSIFKTRFLYHYVVGHGLTVNLNALKKLGGFNTEFWCEDIYLTMNLKFNNIQITPIYELECIDNAVSISQLIKQNSVWYNTTRKYRLIYKDLKNKLNNFSLNGFVGCLNEFKCAINWLLLPVVFLFIFLSSILYKSIILAVLITISFCFYSFINYYITIKTINKLSSKNYSIELYNWIAYSIALLISNIGPIYSFFSNNNIKYKTER